LGEAEVPHAPPGGLRQGGPLVLVLQVVGQHHLQVVLGVTGALPAGPEVGFQLPVAGLLHQQTAGRGRLKGALVALAPDAVVEGHPGAGQQRPVVGPEDAGGEHHVVAARQPGQPAQPGGPGPLHGRVEVADEDHVDGAGPLGPGAFQVRAAAAVQVAGPGAVQAGAGDRLDAGRVAEDVVAARQAEAVVVPQEVGVAGQPDQRHRGRPQSPGDGRVGQVQGQQVRLPAGGQGASHVVPGGGRSDGQVEVALGIEGQAAAGGAGILQGSNAGGTDAFVSRLNATGTALLYSTYVGGSLNDSGLSQSN
jgi:hypothetical protein